METLFQPTPKFAMNFRYDNYHQSDVDEIILNWKGTERQLYALP